MKNINIKSLVSMGAASLLLITAGCAKIDKFGDTNTNPLISTQPITSALLTNAESNMGELVTGIGTQGGVRAGFYAQYYAETQYPDGSLYSEPKLDATAQYSTFINDLQVMINKNSDPLTAGLAAANGSNANQIAIAKIVKAYYFWNVTDRWGDVPYSEALQGAANLFPKYDKQEDIYKGLLKDLTDAVAGFDGGATVKGDILYGGDNAKWKKLANSLRMSMSLRMSKVYPAAGGFAATQFALAYNDIANGYITSNADNWQISFPGGSYRNTWYNTYESRSDYAFSKTVYDAENNLGDTRQTVHGSSNTPFPYGLKQADANSFAAANVNYARVLAPNFRTETSPIVIYSAAMSLLAVAEARERGWITGDPEAAYNAGVTASFGEWGLTIPAAYLSAGSPANYQSGAGAGAIGQNAFGSIPASQTANTPDKISRIALQRWIASYPNGIQGWAEWRRTGVPNLQPTTQGSATPNTIPIRYVYGTNEYATNPTKVAEAASRLTGGDKATSHIWINP